jgi:hypothetical protein
VVVVVVVVVVIMMMMMMMMMMTWITMKYNGHFTYVFTECESAAG